MLAFVKSHQQQFDEAREIYQNLLDDAQNRHDLRAISVNLHQLGMVERLAKQYTKAQQFFEAEHQHLLKHLPNFGVGLSANAYERGYLQLLQGHPTNAEKILQTALQYAVNSGDAICKATSLRGLGEVYNSLNQPVLAKQYLNQSVSIFHAQNDEIGAKEVKDLISKMG